MVIGYAAITGCEEKSNTKLSRRKCYPIMLTPNYSQDLARGGVFIVARLAFACKGLLGQNELWCSLGWIGVCQLDVVL